MRRNSVNNTSRGPWSVGGRILWGLAPFLWTALTAETAPASPIRHRHHPHLAARSASPEFAAWNAFLAGGERHWARVRPPEITSQIHVLMNRGLESAHPTSNPNVEYLMWRRSLAPERFDRFHPRIGPMLQALIPAATTTPVTTPQTQQISPPPLSASDPGTTTTPD